MYSTLGKVSVHNSMQSMKLRIKLLAMGLGFVLTFIVLLRLMSSSLDSSQSKEYAWRRRLDEHNHDEAPEQLNLNELFHMGECLLREAGKHIVRIRQQELQVNHKQDKSVVTKADLESHTIIVHTLEHKFKRLRVLSEENAAVDDDFDLDRYMTACDTYQKQSSDLYTSVSNLQVWIDPLDATQEYSENLIDYVTVMFCIVDKNKPKAGIIHNPFKNVTVSSFYARTHLNNDQELSSRKNRIIISRSHAGSVNATIYEKISQPEIIIAAGSGFKTMSLLNGQADLYLHTSKIYKWDICAPNAIINNHGGRLMVRNGREVDYSDTRKEYLAVDGILASLNNFYYFYDLFKSV